MSREEGIALAKVLGSYFLECSAKTRENVEKCFEDLALKVDFFQTNFEYWNRETNQLILCIIRFFCSPQIMEAPSLIEEGSTVVKRNILKQQEFQPASTTSCCL